MFTKNGYAYDTTPKKVDSLKPISTDCRSAMDIKSTNLRHLCRTTTTIDANWHCDFAKKFGDNLVQIEAQFAVVEAMFKDFLGFKMAFNERRLALGVEIVIEKPVEYFKHRKGAIAGMAYYSIAEKTLEAIGLNCPILVIGLHS